MRPQTADSDHEQRSDPSGVAVECEGLTRQFGRFVAVDGIDLRIQHGAVFGVLGRNGAGKSTLIRMLTTLLPPTSGRAYVAGFDVEREAARVRRAIGYVPQALSADGELTGFENLLLFARLYDLPRAERRARIAEALAFMDLSDHADRLVKEYSGGMIRRLEIAQSTLHRPAVLFLDEPTVGLDPLARVAVWNQLKRLGHEFGTTVVLTTHYLDEAEALCACIGILHQGRLTALGTPADLKASIGPGATIDQVFARYTGAEQEDTHGFASASVERRTADRLG